MTPRRRLLATALTVLAAVWVLALGGFALARSTKVTPDKIARLLRSTNLASLSPEQRARAVRKLAEMLNRLSPEDRRTARMDPAFDRWFRELSDGEKGEFLELTVPTGFNQMLAAFEQMPEDKRRRAVADSVRRLREARERLDTADAAPASGDPTNRPPELTPELQDKVVKLGLKSFYETGSPDLKAEVAPVVEELQRSMESGRSFRERRRPPGE